MSRPILAAALLAAFPAMAQAPNPNPAAANAGVYQADSAHTRVLFSVNHMGFSTYYGGFAGVTGTLTLQPKHPQASQVSVSIPTASISTTNPTLDGELKSADWFNAAKYPAITFKSTQVKPTGYGTARITGDLTLHGITKPITLNARFNAGGVNPLFHVYTVGFDATGQIKRRDFGVTKYDPLVSDEVNIIISAAFEQH